MDCHSYRQGEPVIYKYFRTVQQTIDKINNEHILFVNERPVEIAFVDWFRPGLEIKSITESNSEKLILTHKDFTSYNSIHDFTKNINKYDGDKIIYIQ